MTRKALKKLNGKNLTVFANVDQNEGMDHHVGITKMPAILLRKKTERWLRS